MIKATLSAALCCVLLAGCVAWGRGENGYYPVLVHKPDPRYPNVFVYPPAGDRKTGYAVVDQDPIVIHKGVVTTVSWAVAATSSYVIKEIIIVDSVPQNLRLLPRVCSGGGENPRKTLECTFDATNFPEKEAKLTYKLRVGLANTTYRDKDDITTDPGIWMVD